MKSFSWSLSISSNTGAELCVSENICVSHRNQLVRRKGIFQQDLVVFLIMEK